MADHNHPPDLTTAALALACRFTGRDVDGRPFPSETPAAQVRGMARALEDFAAAVAAAAARAVTLAELRAPAASCGMCSHLMGERAGFLHEIEGLNLEVEAVRLENGAIRLRACDAHAAVYRAMRAPPEEAFAALQDDGYVHEAVHRVLDGPEGTAVNRWDAATKEHIEALGARALRAEQEVDDLRRQLAQRPAG